MLLDIITLLHWVVNFVSLFIFLINLGGWNSTSKAMYKGVKLNGVYNTFCEEGVKIKHIFLLWLFLYDFILIVGFIQLSKLGDITLVKKK